MRKIVIYRVTAIVIIVISILGILLASTTMPNEQKNGFTRRFLTNELIVLQSGSLDASFNSISGITENTIFLGCENPFAVLMLNKNLLPVDTLAIKINLPPEKIVPFHVYVDSPWIYLHFNNLKSIVHGRFPRQELKLIELKSSVFTKSVQISPSSCIIKTIDYSMNRQFLQKLDVRTGDIIKEIEITSDLNSSDWISSDGMLEYEPTSGKLVYVEYQRNRFYCLDSNLNFTCKGRTIDTVTTNEIKLTKEVEKNGKIKMVPSGARIIVNKNCFIDSQHLYIISGLRADNERLKIFNRNTTVDSYSLSNGIYEGSFLIPGNDNEQIRSVYVKSDTLFALYKSKITSYALTIQH